MLSTTNQGVRIVSWNCRDGFQNKLAEVVALNPSVAVIQECRAPSAWQDQLPDTTVVWHGVAGKRGLAVLGFAPWTVELGAALTDEIQLFAPVKVRGPAQFNILGVWTKPMPAGSRPRMSYVGQLHLALQTYRAFVAEQHTVIVGDFNANAIWDHGKPWHYLGVVEELGRRGLVSAYHALSGEAYGHEVQATYRHNTGATFHIDHCFLPRAWMNGACSLAIGDDAWLARSDHRPLIIDIKLNALLRTSATFPAATQWSTNIPAA